MTVRQLLDSCAEHKEIIIVFMVGKGEYQLNEIYSLTLSTDPIWDEIMECDLTNWNIKDYNTLYVFIDCEDNGITWEKYSLYFNHDYNKKRWDNYNFG